MIFWPFTKSYWNWLQVVKIIIYDLKWALLCLNNPQHTSNDDIEYLHELLWKIKKSLFYPQIPSEFQRAKFIKNQWKMWFSYVSPKPVQIFNIIIGGMFGVVWDHKDPYQAVHHVHGHLRPISVYFVKCSFLLWKLAILRWFSQNY